MGKPTSHEDRLILDRRIHNQRLRLRWWEKLFNQHVHFHWRVAHLSYFEAVRRDRNAVAKRAREQAFEEAAAYHDDLAAQHEAVEYEADPHKHHKQMVSRHRQYAAAIRALAKAKEADHG